LCNSNSTNEIDDYKQWLLEWRLFESSINKNYTLAEAQFDSLLALNNPLHPMFISTGLKVKADLGKQEEVCKILSSQNKQVLITVCESESLSNHKCCATAPKRTIKLPKLQKELVAMFVCDQNNRDHLMEDIIKKYSLSESDINICKGTDSLNQIKLKMIIEKYGFPTLDMVGKHAVEGVFYIIQHADRDAEWQKSQLPYIEIAVNNGDIDKSKYAYLYDRIKVNSGKKQLYGTQFEEVDFDNKTTKLRPTEDIKNLDKRRMQLGLSPIEFYKRGMFLDF